MTSQEQRTGGSALTAGQARERLNEIAPWNPAGGADAVSVARWFAMEAQVVWARMMDTGHAIDPRDIGTLHGYFAAAHALLALHDAAPDGGSVAAGQIAEAIDSPGDVGEWLWEHYGPHAREIAALAARLSALTEMDAGGHLHAKPAKPWPYDGPEGRARLTGNVG